MTYLPGTHLVATIEPADAASINNYAIFQSRLNQLIDQYSLQKLGEVYHNFQPAGFTAVICLSESHISI
ncbi:MAG TPA: S-adenosylmethionine decarboxylase, partial [Flavihumibacter sp.]|nr:S-adenosylmethionine decarboxylase [Flavihumibacter sp.]